MAIENIGLYPITIDVYKKHKETTVYANDNDLNGRGLLINLVKNNSAFDSTGIALKIGFRNAVGEERLYDCDIVDVLTGQYKVFYPTEMLEGNGGRVVKLEIKAYEVSGALLNYAPIFVYVNTSEVSDEALTATNEGSALFKALTEYEAIGEEYLVAEGLRDSDYDTAEINRDGLYSAKELVRDNAYNVAETSRNTAYETEEGIRNTQYASSETDRDGLYATAETNRDNLYTTAEANRSTLVNEISAQLAETDQRIDNIIATPVPTGEIIAEEIIDARQGALSVGANITKVKSQLAQKATELSSDTVLYVDNTTGSDENNGSYITPFKSIKKAVESLPTVITGHVKIKLADGVYTEQTSTYSGASIDNYSEKTMTCNVAFSNFQIKEGSSITLEGNPTNPGAVIIDGANAVNTNIFILNTNRININGLTVKNATSSNVQYKRYSSGQLKNLILDGANYGLWGYQYAFVEVQGNVIVKNAAQAVYGTVQTYINLAGITVEDSCTAGVLVSNKTDCAMSQNNLLNTKLNIVVSYGCYVQANGVIFTKNIGRVAAGELYVLASEVTGVSSSNVLEVRDFGVCVIDDVDISSGIDPNTVTIPCIRITDGGVLKVINSLINGYTYGVSANDSGKILIKNTDISNSRYDGINTNKSSSLSMENVLSTTPNKRYGVQSTKTNILDNGGNTISGETSQFTGTNNFRSLTRGTTEERPTTFMEPGMIYFDTTLGKLILYVGSSGYRNLDGSVL